MSEFVDISTLTCDIFDTQGVLKCANLQHKCGFVKKNQLFRTTMYLVSYPLSLEEILGPP